MGVSEEVFFAVACTIDTIECMMVSMEDMEDMEDMETTEGTAGTGHNVTSSVTCCDIMRKHAFIEAD